MGYEYGLNKKVSLEAGFTSDYLINTNNRLSNFAQGFAPVSADQRFLYGTNLSFGIRAKPRKKMNLAFGTALSNFLDKSPNSISAMDLDKLII